MNDPIIDEVRAHRESLAEKLHFDIHRIFLYAKERQENRKTVNLHAGQERPTYPDPQQVAEPDTPYGN